MTAKWLLVASTAVALAACQDTVNSGDTAPDGSGATASDMSVTDGGDGTDAADGATSLDATSGTDEGAVDATDSLDATDGTDEPSCPPPSGERPAAIAEHAHIFDPIRKRYIAYGGNPEFPVNCTGVNSYIAETWSYDTKCGQWSRIDAEAPSPRGRAQAAYVESLHGMLIFGGRFREKGADMFAPYTLYDETWMLGLNGDSWFRMAKNGVAPSARVSSSVIYDPIGDRVVLFGGNTSTSGASYIPLNDVWAWSAEDDQWTKLTTSGAPSARLFASAAYDPVRHRMIVSGGGDANAFLGPFLGDTWALDLASLEWSQLDSGASGAPDRRFWGRMVYVDSLDSVILFGGHDDLQLGNRNDVWRFDLATNTWSALQLNDAFNKPGNGFCDFPKDFATITPGTPERRSSHAMVIDAATETIYIHGGKTDCGLVDDLWSLKVDGLEWYDEEPASVGESCLRFTDAEFCQGHCL